MVDIELMKLKRKFNKRIDKIIKKDIIMEEKLKGKCLKKKNKFSITKGTNKFINKMLNNSPNLFEEAMRVTQV